MKLPLILNSVLWLVTVGTSPVANQQTISIDLTPDVGEDKMSAYIERNMDVMFTNKERSMLFNFTELGQTFYSYFIKSTNSLVYKITRL